MVSKNSEIILWMKEILNTETHTQVLLMNHLQGPWEVWIWVNTVFHIHFPKDRNCEICQRTKNHKGSVQKTYWQSRISCRKIFGDLITAEHKVLSAGCESRNYHRYAVRGARLGHLMDPVVSVQNKKLLRKPKGACKKFLEPNGKRKVIYTDNSLEFGKACKDLYWNHCTSTPYRSQTHEIAERAVSRVKKVRLRYCCNQVWMKDDGQIPWNAVPVLRNIQDFLFDGKIPSDHVFGEPFKGPINRFVH